MNVRTEVEKGIIAETIRNGDETAEHVFPAIGAVPVPICLLHGMWSDARSLYPVMIRFASFGYECYASSYRGHGSGMKVDDIGNVSIDEYLEDAMFAVSSLSRRVHLWGYSLGGLLASQVAIRMPLAIASCTLAMCAPPNASFMSWRSSFRLLKYLPVMMAKRPFVIRKRDADDMILNTVPPDLRQSIRDATYPDSSLAVWQILKGMFAIKPPRCPTLVIGGRYDRLSPYQRRLARKLGADHMAVDCGHRLIDDPILPDVVERNASWICRSMFSLHARLAK